MFKVNKYNNTWTPYKEVLYQSKKEANYAMELDLRIKAGDIIEWDRQIRMPIEVNGEKICDYICDFRYLDKKGVHYVDIKGMKKGPAYQMFKIKKKLVKATYGIDVEEV